MQSKKISFFLHVVGRGGLTRVMIKLMIELSNNGFEVDVLISPNTRQDRIEWIPPEVNIITLNSSRLIALPILIASYLKQEKPDILFSGGPIGNCMILMARTLSLTSTKIFITEHSIPSFDVPEVSNQKIRSILPYLMKKLYPKADEIIAVSKTVAEDLFQYISYPIQNIQVIYNPVVSEDLIQKSQEPIYHSWFDNKEHPIITYVGRLIPSKNITLLVEALSIVNKTNPCKLLVIGEGPELNNLVSKVEGLSLKDKVDFMGHCENPYPFIRQSDLLVLTSKYEGLGNVIIEALACNTHVVATNNLGRAIEILDQGKYGILAANDSQSLAKAITSIITKNISFTELEQRSQIFNAKVSISKYIKLINKY